MTGLTVFQFVLETMFVLAIGYGFYHEEKVIKFERKAFRFIKGSIKLIASEIRKKKNTECSIEIMPDEDVDAQYEYLLNQTYSKVS